MLPDDVRKCQDSTAPEPTSLEYKYPYMLPILYVIVMSAVVPVCIFFMMHGMDSEALKKTNFVSNILSLYFIGMIAAGGANILYSFKYRKNDDAIICLNNMMILKYGMVIFFIVNFFAWFLIISLFCLGTLVASAGAMIIFLIPMLFVIIPAACLITALTMLPGAVYGVQVVILSYRHKLISLPMALVHGILQFCFLADILDTMYLSAVKWKRGKKSAFVMGILYLAVVGFFIYLLIQLGRAMF